MCTISSKFHEKILFYLKQMFIVAFIGRFYCDLKGHM